MPTLTIITFFSVAGSFMVYLQQHCDCLFVCLFFFLHAFVELLSRKQIDLTSMAGVYVVLGIVVLIAEIIWKRK